MKNLNSFDFKLLWSPLILKLLWLSVIRYRLNRFDSYDIGSEKSLYPFVCFVFTKIIAIYCMMDVYSVRNSGIKTVCVCCIPRSHGNFGI